MFIKVSKVIQPNGNADYKTLEIVKIEQPIYNFEANECYLQYNDTFTTHEELIEITEEQYYTAQEEQQKDAVSLEDKVNQLEEENKALRVSQEEQDALIMELMIGGTL